MTRQSALRKIWSETAYEPLSRVEMKPKASKIPRPSPKDFFIASSDKALNNFFDEMYKLSSPAREEMFVQFCLRDNCEGENYDL